MVSKAEIAFGKLGYHRYENDDIVVYYVPYAREDFRAEDITFCKASKRIVMYKGTNMGSDAFVGNSDIFKAICLEMEALNW